MTKRQKNLIKKFCNRIEHYHSQSPKISQQEVLDLAKLGFILQTENPLHEPAFIYALRIDDFRAMADKAGIQWSEQ